MRPIPKGDLNPLEIGERINAFCMNWNCRNSLGDRVAGSLFETTYRDHNEAKKSAQAPGNQYLNALKIHEIM